eukprot:524348-Amorphochlora_amoeboformis.AAC.1
MGMICRCHLLDRQFAIYYHNPGIQGHKLPHSRALHRCYESHYAEDEGGVALPGEIHLQLLGILRSGRSPTTSDYWCLDPKIFAGPTEPGSTYIKKGYNLPTFLGPSSSEASQRLPSFFFKRRHRSSMRAAFLFLDYIQANSQILPYFSSWTTAIIVHLEAPIFFESLPVGALALFFTLHGGEGGAGGPNFSLVTCQKSRLPNFKWWSRVEVACPSPPSV